MGETGDLHFFLEDFIDSFPAVSIARRVGKNTVFIGGHYLLVEKPEGNPGITIIIPFPGLPECRFKPGDIVVLQVIDAVIVIIRSCCCMSHKSGGHQ